MSSAQSVSSSIQHCLQMTGFSQSRVTQLSAIEFSLGSFACRDHILPDLENTN
jgi:hypothetical protein